MLEKKSEQILETSKEEAKWIIKDVPLLLKKCIELDYQIAERARNKSDYRDSDPVPLERRDRDQHKRRQSSDTCDSSNKRRDHTTQGHDRSRRRQSSSRSRKRQSNSRSMRRRKSGSRSKRRQSRSRSRRRSCSHSRQRRSGSRERSWSLRSGSQERSWSSRRKLDEEEKGSKRKWREGESPRQRKTARYGESKSNCDGKSHGYAHKKRKSSSRENAERSSRCEGSSGNSSEWSRSKY